MPIIIEQLSETCNVKMDNTEIQYPNGRFNIIYSSHLLDHIYKNLSDYPSGIRGFYRKLRQLGWADSNIQVAATDFFKNPSITHPNERLRPFGLHDHFRGYRPDYKGRLGETRFLVAVYSPTKFLSHSEIE